MPPATLMNAAIFIQMSLLLSAANVKYLVYRVDDDGLLLA